MFPSAVAQMHGADASCELAMYDMAFDGAAGKDGGGLLQQLLPRAKIQSGLKRKALFAWCVRCETAAIVRRHSSLVQSNL